VDSQQRFLRRKHLLDNMDIYLRESNYHRSLDEDEELQGEILWRLDKELGENDCAFRI
jgi:hypothetical protein